MMTASTAKDLERRYYTPEEPESLGGARGLLRRVGSAKKKKTIEWLRGQDPYTLHKRVVSKFPRRSVIVAAPGEQVQVDLMDVSKHAEDNARTKFLLTAVDVFSKKAWVFPLLSKGGEDVSRALTLLFEREPFRRMQSDKGTEFYNVRVRNVLARLDIKHFSTENETIKAAVVERFNRTLRSRLHRHMTKTNGEKYLDVLQKVVDSYNDSFHSSIDMTPNQVNASNAENVWLTLYDDYAHFFKRRAPKLKKGDHVRISKARNVFTRGYTPNWSREVYRVADTRLDTIPHVYQIKDWAGDNIKGTFYEQELQLINEPDSYSIESVLDTRGRGSRRELFVKWLGYPESFNSWVRESKFV